MVRRSQPRQAEQLVPGVKNILAVASGKGGVGKSTVSVNLAVALAQAGASVGLLDADITGPNIPMMLGLEGQPKASENNKITPLERYGVKAISIQFFVPEGQPIVWRGPLVGGAIQQFLRDVDWGELDYLVIDLPPGTSDAQLTLAQAVPISGAVLVTTPQAVSLADVGKALAMFHRMSVPVIGLVENMTAFACPHCGELTEIFGRGGGERFAAEHKLEYLGGVPLDITVRQGGDVGVPAVAQREPGPAGAGPDLDRQHRRCTDERPRGAGRSPTGADHLLSGRRAGLDFRTGGCRGAHRAVPIVRGQDQPPGPLLRPVRCPSARIRTARRRRRARRASGPSPEAGDRRVVTAMFADLVDYVRMIAEHDPEVVRARVGAALRRMGEAIERLEGTREKFIGDAVFAVFGWPIAHDDDPVRASLAALAIRAMLREPDDGSEPLEVRIGIATGEVVAASREDRSGDLVVTGEAITTAARIQSLARPGEILLDEATVRGARDRLLVDDHGSVVLRGQSSVVRLFALNGEHGLETSRRRGPGADGPLIGRAAEMAVIRKTLRRARRSGRGAVLLVNGEAGMGKSRLVAEVEPDARAIGLRVDLDRVRLLRPR